jgi:ureidoglycolate dehydrogenase (NAD+)
MSATLTVAAPGSRGAVTGSNPLAYAVPAGRHPPLLYDAATSTVAGGKVYAARARGEPIPDIWIIGADGRPTTDPSGFPQAGALLPMAGHKGYGLALLIEVLAGLLPGAAMTWAVGSWMTGDPAAATHHGAAFLAIDPALTGDRSAFVARVEALIDEVHAAPRADGVERILVPGEREWEAYRTATAHGILLPPDVWESLGRAAELAGLDLATLGG